MTDYRNKLGIAISGNPVPFFEKLFPEMTVERSGETVRLQPCPKCGHSDCSTITNGKPFINCLSTGCGLKGYTVDCLASLLGDRAHEIYSVAAEVYGIEAPDGSIDRQQAIKTMAVEHYHAELIESGAPLTYQCGVRGHTLEALKQFKVGVALNIGILLGILRDNGFREEEIEAAKIRIPEGLFVYPYYDKKGNIVRFNTKCIPDDSGNKSRGFSSGLKACYIAPKISKDKVIIVEGENDLISLSEVGETSVIALGGNPSEEQLLELSDLVDDVASVYFMFDNDEAGKAYIEKVSVALPHKPVYVVGYEANDPDDLLKRSGFTGTVEGLLKSATLLPSDGYTMRRHIHSWSLLARTFSIKFTVKGHDSKGEYYGSIEVYIGSELTDAKVNCKISSYRHKSIEHKYIYQFHKILDAFYSGDSTNMDLSDLLDCYEFSPNKSAIVKRIAGAVYSSEHKERDIEEISKRLKTIRDSVLGELNELDNATLSTRDGIPKVKISQFFSIKNEEAYFYFNKVMSDGEGTVRLPYLVSNKREQVRLDLIKRKSPQSMLLLNKKYELPFEVPNAITEYQETSLQQDWVDKYVAGEIPEEELQPEKVIRTLEKQVQRFFFSSDAKIYKLLALWIYGTYMYELFGEYPYLYLTGNKGTGKSTLDNVIYSYGFNAKFAVKITEAAMGRLITAEGGTLIMDELENLTSRSKSQENGISGLLKGGYSKSTGRDYKTNMDKKGIVEGFTVYGPKVISNIFGLDDVLHDRVIEIQMQPASVEIVTALEKIEQHREHNFEEIHEITSLCCLSVLENFQTIYERYNSTAFNGVTARVSQILKPIITLASVAGEDFVEAVEWYYRERLLSSKVEVEESNPEGLVKNILTEVALELLGRESFGWIKQLSADDQRLRSWVIKYPDGFRANQLWIKIALDSSSQGVKYPYSQIPKYLRRVFGKVECDKIKRTTITLLPDEALAKELNSFRPSAWNYRFYFKDLGMKGWDQPVNNVVMLPEPLPVSLFDVIVAKEMTQDTPDDLGGF